MRPTLIFIRAHQIDGHQFLHGDELPPGIVSQEAVKLLLDQGFLEQCPQRRSLYRLLAPFSDCKEQEQLDNKELKAYALP
jgi:hypothetical protein